MAAGNVNSPEYKAFVACTNDICLAVKHNLHSVVGCLFSDGLITGDQRDMLTTKRIPEGERATDLVSKFVLTKIQADPENYHKFVAVLEKDRMQYKIILSKLEQECEKQRGKKFPT